MSLFNIKYDYPDIINDKEFLIMNKKRKEYLKLDRPMTIDEKKDFNKVSTLDQLQIELNIHKKNRNKLNKYTSLHQIVY
jgi:hypothetical protein